MYTFASILNNFRYVKVRLSDWEASLSLSFCDALPARSPRIGISEHDGTSLCVALAGIVLSGPVKEEGLCAGSSFGANGNGYKCLT